MDANELTARVRGDRVTTDKMAADFRVLAADMEQLLKATASHTGDNVAQVRAKAEGSLRELTARIAEMQGEALARTRAAGRATDAYVHDNPWPVMAACGVAGLVVGAMLARSSRADA